MTDRYAILREIQRLDPEKDHCRIVHLTNGYEFPWDSTRALEIALYRTYCVPSISKLLDTTGEFRLRTQQRYDDTAIIVAEMLKHGYDSERGREALRRMNRVHAHFDISNDDYLFVLSTFIFEPVRWYERYGWRQPDRHEKLALYYFWREVGRRMNIKDIAPSYEDFERFSAEYEQKHFRYADTNKAIGEATRNLFAKWYAPVPPRLIFTGIYAMLDENMLKAFGFPKPPGYVRTLLNAGMRARAAVLRRLPPRRTTAFFVDRPTHTYPNGYKITDLGPSHIVAKLNRKDES
jgi:hypothetical protein